MAEVIWSDPALVQLDSIAEYIALDKPEAAKSVVQQVLAITDHLQRFRFMGRPVPEFPHPLYRQVWIRPCWIYYRMDGADVRILHVRRAEQQFSVEDLRHGEP